MASSCVPPKSCVVHDPDPSGHDDHSDTSSECGSLCTCTSGSMASIATIGSNNRVPDRQGQDGESEALVAPLTDTQVVPQMEEEDEDNRYFVVRVPQRVVCCRELRSLPVTASLRHFLLTSSEFFPWLAGFVVIYYSYCWWGMASGFSAFLFMIGAHAVLRLVRTRGVLACVPFSSQTQDSDTSEGEDESDAELQRAPQEVTIDRSAEKPPSYDVAVVKPPPYDLQFHLTPKERHSGPPKKPQHFPNAERCPIPDTVSTERWTPSHTVDESENDVLPSYHDAMKLSLRNDSDGRDQRNGESS